MEMVSSKSKILLYRMRQHGVCKYSSKSVSVN